MYKIAPVPALNSDYSKIVIYRGSAITSETLRLIRPRARSSSNEKGGAYKIKSRPHAHAHLSNKSQPVCRISRGTVMFSARALEERNTLVFYDHAMFIFDNHM